MNSLRDALTKLGLLKDDLDYHLIVVWWALVLELRNKHLGILRALGLYHYRHDYPIYAGCLGCVCQRVPCYDGESCIPNEGSPVPSVAAGRNECGFSGSRQFEASRTWPT